MIEDNNEVWDIITSVLNDTASLEERERLDSWLNESRENQQTYEILLNTSPTKKEYSPDVKTRVLSDIQKTIIANGYIRKLQFWKYGVAASLAVILALGIILIRIKSKSPLHINNIETSCAFGNKSKVNLSDGTVVYLNSGSSVFYPSQFSGDYRKVILKGEAYFEVEKDPKHPFIVQTGDINIKVTGTHFNVKNYDDDKNIETSLLEGSVEVSGQTGSDNPMALSPNQQAVYDKSTRTIRKRKVDAELMAIWKDGKYYFEHERFITIAKKLERQFNVRISINSERLNQSAFSGIFDKNRTVYQILDAMKNYSNFNYEVKGDSIFIDNKRK